MIALTQDGETEQDWTARARCRDGLGTLTELFFSEQLDDIAQAKAFCAECPVRAECLAGALAREEPWGVWGGQLVWKGRVLAQKRRRGRPPLPRDPDTGEVVRDPGRIAELRERQALVEARAQAQVEADADALVARSA